MLKFGSHFSFLSGISNSDRLGILGVLLVAFFGWVGVAGAYIGLAFVALATIINFRELKLSRLWCLSSTRLFLLLILYVLAWELVIRFAMPEGGISSESQAWVLRLFPWLTIWFYRFPWLVPWVLVLAAIGLFGETVAMAIERWDQFSHVLEGGHVFVAKAWGLYLGTVSLGLVVFFPRVLSLLKGNGIASWLLRLLYLAVIIWMFQCLLAAQARTAWVSFFIVLLLVLSLFIVDFFGKRQGSRKLFVGFALSLVVGLSSVIILNLDSIASRFSNDKTNIEKIIAGDKDLSYSSATYRYLLFKYGMERWSSSPLFGLGPQSTKAIIKASPNSKLHNMPHFHSGYLEVMVQLGIIGLVLLGAAVVFMLIGLVRAYLTGLVAGDYALFFGGVFIMIAFWSILNFRMLNADWLFYWIMLVGICQSYGMRYWAYKFKLEQSGT